MKLPVFTFTFNGRSYLIIAFIVGFVLFSQYTLYNIHPSTPHPLRASEPSLKAGHTASTTMSPIIHIVLFRFPSPVPSELVKPVCDSFFALKDLCIHPDTKKPYILSIKGGLDNSEEALQAGNTHAFVLEFASLWDRDYYVAKDPAHETFKGMAKNAGLLGATVVDFEDKVY